MTAEALPAKRTFECVLHVSPKGKKRHRFSAGRTHSHPETVAAEAEIRWLVQMKRPPMMTGPLYMRVRAYFLRPKSAKKRVHHTVKPDGSNVLKLVEDALNGLLYPDDSAIVDAQVQKFYGEEERIELEVGEVG